VFALLRPWLGSIVLLGVDDTLARKRGLKMFGTGMHIDPLLSSRGYKVTNRGHCWVVLSVLVEFPIWPGRYFSLPILFRLYLNKKKAKKLCKAYRSKPHLTIEMVDLLCKRFENRRFHLVGDSAYGGQSMLGVLPGNCDLTSRAVLDARLYDPPPAPEPGRGLFSCSGALSMPASTSGRSLRDGGQHQSFKDKGACVVCHRRASVRNEALPIWRRPMVACRARLGATYPHANAKSCSGAG